MHTNIITFPKASQVRKPAVIETLKDNVISLKDWRTKAKCRRTNFGVFFTTDVLRFSNAAA